ncbi:dienelactone hydrolase [Hyaloraphidium curvatum]|nr:dienelactone hydrolase [Hyaloraphidium curvatum]
MMLATVGTAGGLRVWRGLGRRLYTTGATKLPPFLSFNPSPDATPHPMKSSAVDPDLPLPAVLVLQEWWGVNNQIKAHAQRIANGTGCVAVVPDMYNGKVGLDREEASHLMSNLDWNEGLERLAALVDHLRSEGHHDPAAKRNRRKIGSVGFCMGGALSLALAGKLQGTKSALEAAVSFYGVPSPNLGISLQKIPLSTPVQLHTGELDNLKGFSDPETFSKLHASMLETIKAAGGSHARGLHRLEEALFIYPGQGHAFMNDEPEMAGKRKELGFAGGGDKKVQAQAWERVFRFFSQHLKEVE